MERRVPRTLRDGSTETHRMSFCSVFMAVIIAFALILSAFLGNRARPSVECYARLQHSVMHEYKMSAHAKKEG